MSQKNYYHIIIKETSEKEELLKNYQKRIKNLEARGLEEFQKRILRILGEIDKKVKFVGGNWNARWKGFLNQLKNAINEKLIQVSDDFSPHPVRFVPQMLKNLGLDNLLEILELKTEILKLQRQKIIDREKERRYERIKKTFEKMGWILEVKPSCRSVTVLRKEDKCRRVIFGRIEKMKKRGGKE